MMRVLLMALCLCATACAHKQVLKTPSQMVIDQKKKEARAAKDAAREAKKQAEMKAKAEETSNQVVVPEGAK